ncbi:MAG: 4-alpha-glucanotransferase [Gemmataceae bacterium]|nr:4-alpha-glucanotransferase [Gemmataceae bacterium]
MSYAYEKISTRTSGIILHPISLPGPYGIGDLGPAAYAWIDALVQARQKWWQILPLGPTGFGDSPYQCFSAFAGNPLLVSPDFLREDDLLDAGDLSAPAFPADHVDYGPVIGFKNQLLNRAWENFQGGRGGELRARFDAFIERHQLWLNDFALFMALKDAQVGLSWQEWPRELRLRDPRALDKARQELAGAIGLHQFRQFLFARQWQRLRQYVHQKGLRIIGDIPIFVASDSADVWANSHLFQLDPECRPRVVAGVPPDYFSATGQLWGNPLYDWAEMEKTGFAWWVARFQASLELVDIVRLDHFRGFEGYWEVPAGHSDAVVGRWVKAPGEALLTTVQRVLGRLPIIAEDLGVITPEVLALRERFELPGMRVLQFAFGDKPTNAYLPHNYEANTVVYTGTHDNDTTRGWYETAGEQERDHVRRYLGRDAGDIAWDFIRTAWASVAEYALAPLQDVLNLGPEARMNTPGRPAGNWSWRYLPAQLHAGVLGRLAELTELYGRA